MYIFTMMWIIGVNGSMRVDRERHTISQRAIRIKKIYCIALCVALFPAVGCTASERVLTLWIQEDANGGVAQFAESLASEFREMNPEVTLKIARKESEAIQQYSKNVALVDELPDLLWVSNEHIHPLAIARRIRPVARVIDVDRYINSVVLRGRVWGVPISVGNHLMLLYNTAHISHPPRDTDELIALGSAATYGDQYGIVWNQFEPLWLIPWLGGFGGAVFAKDGVTPTLDTSAMVSALQFLLDLRNVHRITPQETDYSQADALFKDGEAAMIINGDWALEEYREALGDRLGIAPLPQVAATDLFPAPYTSGMYFAIPADVTGKDLKYVAQFIEYATGYENQIRLSDVHTRVPALREALDDIIASADSVRAGSSLQAKRGIPMPSGMEMRCNWDAIRAELNRALAGEKSATDAARDMQIAAEACIAQL